jgi:hypothetical protein
LYSEILLRINVGASVHIIAGVRFEGECRLYRENAESLSRGILLLPERGPFTEIQDAWMADTGVMFTHRILAMAKLSGHSTFRLEQLHPHPMAENFSHYNAATSNRNGDTSRRGLLTLRPD